MKKFFKALALVLALALVIGVVPAQATSAKVKAVKKLYVGGAQGKSADGKLTSSIKNKVAIYKLAGYTKATKEGHKFTAEVQKDNGIVKITKNYVVAQKLGKALVDIYVDGEKVGTTTINSKINATEDTLQILCNGEAMPEEFVVAGKYTFTLPRVGKDSDERRLYINGELVADDADHPRTYTHTFTKSEEGEVTFKFEAYQDAKLDGALVSKEYKAKVVPPKAQSIKQTAWDSFEITFAGDIEAGGYYADAKAWETTGTEGIANDVYYKVGGVRVPFSSVKTSTPKENVLKVKMFGAFTPDTTYYVDIAGKTFEFKAAGNKAKDVASIEFTKTTAVVETNDSLGYKLFNSAGIDITGTAETADNGDLQFTTDSVSAALDSAGRTIYFGTVGDTAKVTATYTFYDPDDNYTAKKTTASATIVCVAAATTDYVSAEYSIGGDNYASGIHTLKMGETVDPTLYVRAKFVTGTTTSYVALGETLANGFPLQATVSDEHYAMMSGPDSIVGVNTGKTSIILFYTNASGNAVVIGVLPIEVVAKRAATSLVANVTDYYTGAKYLNTNALAGDKVKIDVTVRDQYGDKFGTGNAVTFELRSASNGGFVAPAGVTVNNTVEDTVVTYATGATSTTETSVSFTVKACNLTTVVSFKVKDVDANSGTTLTPASTATGADVALTTGQWNNGTTNYDGADTVEMTVNQMAGLYWTGLEPIVLTSDTITAAKGIAQYTQLSGATVTGSAVVAKVQYNGSVLGVNAGGALNAKNVWLDSYNKVGLDEAINNIGGNTIEFDLFGTNIGDGAQNSGNAKLAAGTYTVLFYQITGLTAATATADGTSSYKYLGSKTLAVTDNQALPTAKQIKQTATNPANAVASVQECYEFYWNGAKLDSTAVKAVDSKLSADGKLYVYYAVIEVTGVADSTSGVSCLYEAGWNNAATYDFVVKIGELLN